MEVASSSVVMSIGQPSIMAVPDDGSMWAGISRGWREGSSWTKFHWWFGPGDWDCCGGTAVSVGDGGREPAWEAVGVSVGDIMLEVLKTGDEVALHDDGENVSCFMLLKLLFAMLPFPLPYARWYGVENLLIGGAG